MRHASNAPRTANAMTSGIARRRSAAKAEGGTAYLERREEMIHAAARVFKEKGLSKATLNDVADAIGTDRASLYYYFGSKQELFHEVVLEAVEANVARAEEIRAHDAGAPEKVRTLVHALLASYAAQYPFLFVYIQENLNQVTDDDSAWADQMRRLNHRYDTAVVGIVEQGVEDGSFRRLASPRILAFGLIGMLNWTHRWFNPDSFSATDVADAYADVLLDGLNKSA